MLGSCDLSCRFNRFRLRIVNAGQVFVTFASNYPIAPVRNDLLIFAQGIDPFRGTLRRVDHFGFTLRKSELMDYYRDARLIQAARLFGEETAVHRR